MGLRNVRAGVDENLRQEAQALVDQAKREGFRTSQTDPVAALLEVADWRAIGRPSCRHLGQLTSRADIRRVASTARKMTTLETTGSSNSYQKPSSQASRHPLVCPLC